MFSSVERYVLSGEPLKLGAEIPDSSLIAKLDTGMQIVPFQISIPSFSYERKRVREVSTLYIDAELSAASRYRPGIEDPAIIELPGVLYPLNAEDILYLQGLRLTVKLPDEPGYLYSYPCLYSLANLDVVSFVLFGKSGKVKMHEFTLDNFRSLRVPHRALPALVLPKRQEVVFDGEYERGYLAIGCRRSSWENIEVQFDLMEQHQIPLVQYADPASNGRNITAIGRNGLWEDWSKLYQNLPEETLTVILEELSFKMKQKIANIQEIDYIRHVLSLSGEVIDRERMVYYLLLYQTRQARWLKKRLDEDSSPVA